MAGGNIVEAKREPSGIMCFGEIKGGIPVEKDDTDYAFMKEEQDLLQYAPILSVLKKKFPSYIKQAEETQNMGRRFAREVMAPVAVEIDKKCSEDLNYVDWDFYRKAAELGIPTSFVPKKMGGAGWSVLDAFVFVEEGSAVSAALTILTAFNGFGFACAGVEFKPLVIVSLAKELIEQAGKGEPVFLAWAVTEPSAGTDVEHAYGMARYRPSIEAKKVEGGYIVNGRKCFITNGSLATAICFNAPMDRARPLETNCTFMIRPDTPGFSIGTVENKCGQKANPTAELIFEDVFIPEENRWAPEGEGFPHSTEVLSLTRGVVGTLGVGIARGAVERAVRYASEKKVRGHRLIDEGWVQFALADVMKDIVNLRQTWVNFAVALDFYSIYRMLNNPVFKVVVGVAPKKLIFSDFIETLAGTGVITSAITSIKKMLVPEDVISNCIRHGSALKVAGTDLAMRASSVCADIVGLEGTSRRHGIEMCFRDAKVTQIYEGTNQINRFDVFEREVGYYVQ